MRKRLLICTIIFLTCNVHAQLNPVKNLQYSQSYVWPVCCGCPQFNCFLLQWSAPDNSASDTLIGYTIYHDDSLYIFTPDTFYGTGAPNSPTTCCPDWYGNMQPFWITVRAVYDHDSLLSIADDSAQVLGVMIGVNEYPAEESLSVSPNPFTTGTTFHASRHFSNATLTVDNFLGQTVAQIKNISGKEITFNRGNHPNGLYFFRISEDKRTFTGKLVLVD